MNKTDKLNGVRQHRNTARFKNGDRVFHAKRNVRGKVTKVIPIPANLDPTLCAYTYVIMATDHMPHIVAEEYLTLVAGIVTPPSASKNDE